MASEPHHHGTVEAGASSTASSYELIAGDASVDFVNTIESWHNPTETDRLHAYADFVDWSEQAGLVGPDASETLRAAAREHEEDAERVLRRVHALRDCLYRVFVAAEEGKPPDERALRGISAEVRRAQAHSHLSRTAEGLAWELDGAQAGELDWPLWKLVHAAAELLTSKTLHRVRRCADEACRWFFVDRSRNHSRRWCDMAVCGNRAKARRNYARQKERRLASSE